MNRSKTVTARVRLGAQVLDRPRFEMALRGLGPYHRLAFPWVAIRNRDERLTLDGRGARCEWRFTSDCMWRRSFPPPRSGR